MHSGEPFPYVSFHENFNHTHQYQTLIGCMAMFFASSMGEMALAEAYHGDDNLIHLATNMHVASDTPSS